MFLSLIQSILLGLTINITTIKQVDGYRSRVFNHLLQCLCILGTEYQANRADIGSRTVGHTEFVAEAHLHGTLRNQTVCAGSIHALLEIDIRTSRIHGAITFIAVIVVIDVQGFVCQVVDDARHLRGVVVDISVALGLVHFFLREGTQVARTIVAVVIQLVQTVLQACQLLIDIENHVLAIQQVVAFGGEGGTDSGCPATSLREVGVLQHGSTIVAVGHAVGHGVVPQALHVGLFCLELLYIQRAVVEDVVGTAVSVVSFGRVTTQIVGQQVYLLRFAHLAIEPVLHLIILAQEGGICVDAGNHGLVVFFVSLGRINDGWGIRGSLQGGLRSLEVLV